MMPTREKAEELLQEAEKWNSNLEIKKQFEEKMAKDIYTVVEKDTFRP